MATARNGWFVKVGVPVHLDHVGNGYVASAGGMRVGQGDMPRCIAAIERELLAIAAAIPSRPACANCGGRHTSTTDEETCFEARVATPARESKP
jgi:hypothetical protein